MNDQSLFKRIASFSAILYAPIGLASFVLVAMSVDFNADAVSNVADVITLGGDAAGPLHLAWTITDLFSNLLLAPAALFLWFWLKSRNPNLVTLWTFFGLAYVLTAVVSVSLLGGAVPPLMRAYETASASQQEVLLAVFQTVFDMLFYGIGPLTFLFGGLWWLGTGSILRNERRLLGLVTVALGFLALGVWTEQIFRIEPLIMLEDLYIFLSYIWAVWLGIVIWRRDQVGMQMMEPAAAD